MVTNDLVTLYGLYGFKSPICVNLDEIDAEWLEDHADGFAYAQSRDALPDKFWLDRGYTCEFFESHLVHICDERVEKTICGMAYYEKRGLTVEPTWEDSL